MAYADGLVASIGNIADALLNVVDLLDRATESKANFGTPLLGGPVGGGPSGGGLALSSGGGGAGGGGAGGGGLTGVLLGPAFGQFGPPRTVEQLDAECTRTEVPVLDPLNPLNDQTIIGWSCPGGLFYADPAANELGDRVSGRGSGGAGGGGGGRTPLQIQGTNESGRGIQSVFDPRRVGPGRAAGGLTADGDAIVGALKNNTAAVNNLAAKVDGDLGALVRSKDGF